MNVVIGLGGKEVSWDHEGTIVRKSYSDILMGYEILPDDTGILLLEPTSIAGAENAVIYNSDGSLRWRLPFPKDLGRGNCFDRVGISEGQLVVIGISDNRDVKFEVDYDNLKYLDISGAQ